MEGAVPPFLEDTKSCCVDVEDGKNEGHRIGELIADPSEAPESHLRIVLGNLFGLGIKLGGASGLSCVFIVIIPSGAHVPGRK